MNRSIVFFAAFLLVPYLLIGTPAAPVPAPTPVPSTGDFNVRIEQVASEDYPSMKVYVSVEKEDGTPISALVRGNFGTLIDAVPQKDRLDVSAFQYSDAPVSYVALITVNGLLEGEPLQQQKNALLNLVDQLRDKDTLSVYLVGEPPKSLFENLRKDKIDLSSITKLEVDPENNARLYDSISLISQKVKEAPNERKVMLVLSDGRDQQSRYTLEQTLKVAGSINAPVYTIGIKIMGGAGLSMLDNLSQVTGGRYFYARSNNEITAHMNSLLKYVLQSYVVQFSARGISSDDDFHQLTMQVSDSGLSAKASHTFLAKKIPFPLWLKIVILVLVILLIAGLVLLFILLRISHRKKMGINKRRCPDCGARMKDDWDTCPFCRYLTTKKRKKPKKDKK